FMDNNQNKFSNADDYDLILEEKEKELKKEKRNKVILGSSLALLLLLGSTAVVAPIISVAADKNNSANINNIKIPSKLTFTNSDITTLIDGYKSEIQARKLSFNEFQTDFTNITKKYIVASNLSIGTIVQSAKITQNADTKDFNIEIVLDESKKYWTNEELTPATLNENTLTISFKENEKLLGDFFTPIEIDKTVLDNLENQIQEIIDNNKLTDSNNDLNSIKDLLSPNIDPSQIGNIKYEEPNLIIEPVHPNKFGPSDSNWIVDGNIVIPNLKLYTLIKFSNLQKLFDALNNIIHSDAKQYEPEEFKEYINQNLNEIKQLIYNNLEISNKNKFKVNDILNVLINTNNELIIELNNNNNYLKYQLNETNANFVLNNNELIIKDLDFKHNWSPDSWFVRNDRPDSNSIAGLTDLGKQQNHIILPGWVTYMNRNGFQNLENLISFDMSNAENFKGLYSSSSVAYSDYAPRFPGCKNLKSVIFPKNSRITCFWYDNFTETKLENLIFPKSVLVVHSEIFRDVTTLQWVYLQSKIDVQNSNSTTTPQNLFAWAKKPVTIYVPNQELKTYYSDMRFNNVKEIVIGEPPTKIKV
ncbi:MAG: hypothetical protein K2K73_03345, partial [Ureaplasma sp.]|nr:hypothetical protein [Ureaplasma sp.]